MKRRKFLTATAGGLSWLVTQALAATQSKTSLREKEKAIEAEQESCCYSFASFLTDGV